MKREEFYESKVLPAGYGTEVKLPVTRAEFEDLLKQVALKGNLCDVDDDMRSVLVGYVHHTPNTQSTVMFDELVAVLHKSVSNHLTWTIDQEIKAKRLQEAKEAADKAKDQSNVLNLPPRPTPGTDVKA